ncbi:MAG: hypothetical protein QXY50_07800 [Candidatus Caldarchaeum sp.]
MKRANLQNHLTKKFIYALKTDSELELINYRSRDTDKNKSLFLVLSDFENSVNNLLTKKRGMIAAVETRIPLEFGSTAPTLNPSSLAKDYNADLIQEIWGSVDELTNSLEDSLKYYFSLYSAYDCLNQLLDRGLLEIDESSVGDVYILELFVNKNLIGDIPATNQDLVDFILDLCAAVNRITSVSDKWRQEIRTSEWKKIFLQLLQGDKKISQRYGRKLPEYWDEVVKIFQETVNHPGIGQLGIDHVIEKLFEQHIILEIFCFRRLAEAGLSIIPKIRMKGGEIEADLLIIIDENEACVVEVTSRKQIPDDKLIQMEKSCNYIKNMGFERLGNIIICSKETELKARLERINFNELNDKCKILSKVYGVVSSS